MNINALSNPYLRQEFPVESLPMPAENPERARQDPAARALVVKVNERAAGLTRKKTADTVDISNSAKDDSKRNDLSNTQTDDLRYDKPKMRNWDHKLVAWFKTAITVQGTMPQSRGSRVDILV